MPATCARSSAQDYRILRVELRPRGPHHHQELHDKEEPLALIVADQRMPELEGVELLTASREFFPDAKRVLLTAYADTEAAVRAINSARLDHYLMKPWDPPENLLYPTLHDLLTAWQATHKPQFDGVRLIGFQWSPLSHELKDFLSGYMVGYQWLDYETSPEAQELVQPRASTPPTCRW